MFSGRKKALALLLYLKHRNRRYLFFFPFFCDVASIDFISLVIALTSSTPSHLMIDRLFDWFCFFFYKQHARKDEWQQVIREPWSGFLRTSTQ